MLEQSQKVSTSFTNATTRRACDQTTYSWAHKPITVRTWPEKDEPQLVTVIPHEHTLNEWHVAIVADRDFIQRAGREEKTIGHIFIQEM